MGLRASMAARPKMTKSEAGRLGAEARWRNERVGAKVPGGKVMIHAKYGKAMRLRLKQLGMKQVDFAKETGLDQCMVSSMVNGRFSLLGVQVVATALGLPANGLRGLRNTHGPKSRENYRVMLERLGGQPIQRAQGAPLTPEIRELLGGTKPRVSPVAASNTVKPPVASDTRKLWLVGRLL